MKILTLFIPTYNRASSVKQLIDEIIDNKIIDYVNLLVIDDGTTDNTSEVLSHYSSNSEIKILRNEVNKGMAYTYFRSFNECDTEYMMMVADDDIVYLDGIIELLAFIAQRSPDIAAAGWLSSKENGMKSHRKNSKERRIKYSDLRIATNLAPGLIYNVKAVLPELEILTQRLNNACYATIMYPQVVLVLLMAFHGRICWWCSANPGGFRYKSMPSGLKYNDGTHYLSVNGFWKDQLAFMNLYEYMGAFVGDKKTKKIFNNIILVHLSEVHQRIENGIGYEAPYLLQYYYSGAVYKMLKSPYIFLVALFSVCKQKTYALYASKVLDR